MAEKNELELSTIPVEVIYNLLEWLKCRDILSLAASCKRFKEIVVHNQGLWKKKLQNILPPFVFASLVKNGVQDWLQEIKSFYLLKERIYNELMTMSEKFYWYSRDMSLEDVRIFFDMALSSHSSYFYVVFILQELLKTSYIQMENDEHKKPFTMTESFYAKVILRYLIQTFLAVKWVKSHIEKEMHPEFVVNFFLQWIESVKWYPDHLIAERIDGLAKRVKTILDHEQPRFASLSVAEKIECHVVTEKQVLNAISQVIYKQDRMAVTDTANLDTLDAIKILDTKCSSLISIACIYHAVARSCGVQCELVVFPNHLFLEWRDGTDGWMIDLGNGKLMPKRRCPYSGGGGNRPISKYCPDSLLQYIYTAFTTSMGALKSWSTQNAYHLLDYLGTSQSQFNPYRHFLTYLISFTGKPAMIAPLDITYLQEDQICLIRSLAFLNPPVDQDTREYIVKKHTSAVKYAVGMVCYHKIYHYVGIIKGWDMSCDVKVVDTEGSELDQDLGMEQPFYYILAVDQSTRYVAQENLVEISHPSRLYHLEETIAQEFSYFDGFAYVPNDQKAKEYPEDAAITEAFRQGCSTRPHEVAIVDDEE